MAFIENDGVKIFYKETGSGAPILFLHEYGGDYRSWEPQVRYFSRNYRCITMCNRGYPPSDVPPNPDQYGQDINLADIIRVMDDLDLQNLIIIGLSMGAYNGLRLALSHPDRIRALVAASGGSGSNPDGRDAFRQEAQKLSEQFLEHEFMPADGFANGPTRVQLKRKDPQGWEEVRAHLGEHPAVGAAFTLLNVQAERPSLYEFEDEFKACRVPTLLMAGDEDEACLDVNVWLKRTMPTSGLYVAPKSGHLLNLEDPARFNHEIADFLRAVDAGTWPVRDPQSATFTGVGPAVANSEND
jgi:pimeloyl-ACP methyl ester carboxylesterase